MTDAILTVTVFRDDRIPLGEQALWLNKKLVHRCELGADLGDLQFDAVSINPLDYQRFKETGLKYDA